MRCIASEYLLIRRILPGGCIGTPVAAVSDGVHRYPCCAGCLAILRRLGVAQ